jgi:hypothetical protein
MKTCPKCRHSVPDLSKYCPYDGYVFSQGDGDGLKKIIILIIVSLVIILVIVFASKSTHQPKTTSTNSYIPNTPTQEVYILPTDNNVQPITAPTLPAPTPTFDIPTETRVSCGGAPPIRVEIGDDAQVLSNGGRPLYLRSVPKVGTNVVLYLHGGDKVLITDGPVCSNDVSFFKVKVLNAIEPLGAGMNGWLAEAEADTKNYYIELIP